MKNQLKSILAIAICAFAFQAFSQVTMRDTSWTWQHFDFTLKADNSINTYSTSNIVTQDFSGKIIENEYIKVLLLPEYGGRILSYIYKPTNQEQFYQNPVGAAFNIGATNFYFDWLMVYGGVFPTFPEAEHGKAWNLPWDFQVLTETTDQITIRMSYTDDVHDLSYGNPNNFNNGLTGITCHYDVTVYKGRSNIQCDVTLVNDDNACDYEYWTCCTFTPGSVIGDPKSPGNSEIVSEVTEAKYKSDWWGWMGSVDTHLGDRVYEFNNLKMFNNWDGPGIAYAKPDNPGNYFGVINHQNNTGVFRIADNENHTSGLKMWTWGYDASVAADPYNYDDVEREYIELWAGLNNEFFWDVEFAANEQRSFQEDYTPTIGISAITEINEHVAVFIEYDSNAHEFIAQLFTTYPEGTVNVALNLNGSYDYELYNQNVVSDPLTANVISLQRYGYNLEIGSYDYEIVVSDDQGTELLRTSITYTNTTPVGVFDDIISDADFKIYPNPSTGVYTIESEMGAAESIIITDMAGKMLIETSMTDEIEIIDISQYPTGIYFLKTTLNGSVITKKVVKF